MIIRILHRGTRRGHHAFLLLALYKKNKIKTKSPKTGLDPVTAKFIQMHDLQTAAEHA